MCVISITYPSFSDVFLRDAEACCLYRRNCMISFLRGGFLTFKIVSCRVGVNPLLLFFTCCRFLPFSAKGSTTDRYPARPCYTPNTETCCSQARWIPDIPSLGPLGRRHTIMQQSITSNTTRRTDPARQFWGVCSRAAIGLEPCQESLLIPQKHKASTNTAAVLFIWHAQMMPPRWWCKRF